MPRIYPKGKTCTYCEQVIEYNSGTGSFGGNPDGTDREYYHVGCQIVWQQWEHDYKALNKLTDRLIEDLQEILIKMDKVAKTGGHLKVVKDDQ